MSDGSTSSSPDPPASGVNAKNKSKDHHLSSSSFSIIIHFIWTDLQCKLCSWWWRLFDLNIFNNVTSDFFWSFWSSHISAADQFAMWSPISSERWEQWAAEPCPAGGDDVALPERAGRWRPGDGLGPRASAHAPERLWSGDEAETGRCCGGREGEDDERHMVSEVHGVHPVRQHAPTILWTVCLCQYRSIQRCCSENYNPLLLLLYLCNLWTHRSTWRSSAMLLIR